MIVIVKIAKEKLREKYKRTRLGMNKQEVYLKSMSICNKLLAEVDWPKVKKLHIYVPIGKLNEVDTAELLTRIRSQYPLINIATTGPSKNESVPSQKFDLIIVPALAFDKNNYRLGWGGGWYDRFLAAQPRALKIGLGFQNGFIKESFPYEPHDIPLDKIITEV